MIERIIDWCAANRFLVFTGLRHRDGVGHLGDDAHAARRRPDISDVQVIVSTEWMGRSPDLIEDQITYPIVSALISTPKVKAVRGFTDFGISYVYVIFQDGTDMYWARSRVVEYLQGIRGQLPENTNPIIGQMPPVSAGCSNTPWWTRPASTAWPICAGSRIGISATGWRRCPASRRSPALAGSSSSTRSTSIRISSRPSGSALRTSSKHQDEQQRCRGASVGVLRPRVHGPRAGLPHVGGGHRRRLPRRQRRRHAQSACVTWPRCASGQISVAASRNWTARASRRRHRRDALWRERVARDRRGQGKLQESSTRCRLASRSCRPTTGLG